MRLSCVVLTAVLLKGCAAPGPAPQSPLDRLSRDFPGLSLRSAVVLADFESPEQAGYFVSDAEAAPQVREQALHAHLSGERELRLELSRIPRDKALDWNRYAMLLMRARASAGSAIILAVESGAEPLRWERTIALQDQWTPVRVDIAGLGDEIDLADVRSITWRAAVPQSAAIELELDDLALVDNTHWQFGEKSAAGGLYAYTRGMQLVVGAHDRFELAFENGAIVALRGPDAANLTVSSGLGPWPIPLPADWQNSGNPVVYDDPALLANWGEAVRAKQSLVEVSEVALIVRCEWAFVPDAARSAVPGAAPAAGFASPAAAADGQASPPGAASAPAAAPGISWTYTIEPTGEIYIETRIDPADRGWSASQVGFALALDGRRGLVRQREAANSLPGRGRYVLLSRTQPGRSDLLWAVVPSELQARQAEYVTSDGRRLVEICGARPYEGAGVHRSVHLLRVWPPDIDSPIVGDAIAEDFQRPAGVHVLVGRIMTDRPGDADQDGFDERAGRFTLQPDHDLLRFEFDPSGVLRLDSTFRVLETRDRRCWIYVDGRPLPAGGRDANGLLEFTLPRLSGRAVTVEVHVK